MQEQLMPTLVCYLIHIVDANGKIIVTVVRTKKEPHSVILYKTKSYIQRSPTDISLITPEWS